MEDSYITTSHRTRDDTIYPAVGDDVHSIVLVMLCATINGFATRATRGGHIVYLSLTGRSASPSIYRMYRSGDMALHPYPWGRGAHTLSPSLES